MTERLKIACHIHSEWSYDANWPLEKLASFFAKKGYRALLMSEHDRGFSRSKLEAYREACASASNENITLIPGIEYSDPSNTIHILSWGNVPFGGQDQATFKILEHIKAHQGITVFAHPSRKSAWKQYDPQWEPLLDGIELWNRKSDGISPSPHARLIAQKTELTGFYGLDFHKINQSFPLALTIKSDSSFESSILNSIRLKDFELRAYRFVDKQIEKQPLKTITHAAELFRRTLAQSYRTLCPR